MSRHTVDDLQAIADAIVAMAEPGEQIEANVARSRETDIRVYNGELEHFVSAQSQGISVRVIKDGRTGSSHAGTLDETAWREVLAEAREIAKQLAKEKKQQATKRQMNAWIDNEKKFHELLITSARNELLAKVIHEHRAISEIFDAQRSKPHLLTAEVGEFTCEGKSQLIESLRQRDSRLARDLMSKQIQRGRKQMMKNIK